MGNSSRPCLQHHRWLPLCGRALTSHVWGPVSIPVTANGSELFKVKGLFPSLSPSTANSRNGDHGLLFEGFLEPYGFWICWIIIIDKEDKRSSLLERHYLAWFVWVITCSLITILQACLLVFWSLSYSFVCFFFPLKCSCEILQL